MKSVVFDTDIGIDDALALLFLHCAKDVSISAITTRFGNASVEDTTRNALAVVEKFGIEAPVYRGAAHPIGSRLGEGYPDHVHGKDGLGDIDLDEPTIKEETSSAAEAIVNLASGSKELITIIAVGGLTNIALAMEIDPEITERIAEIVVMGGAFGYHGHSGNVSPVAEANIASDPLAADIVFASKIPTTIVGLDVTHEVITDGNYIDTLAAQAGELGQFVKVSNRHYFGFHESISGKFECPLHDSCAVAYFLQPHLFKTIAQPVRVVTDGIAIGQTIHSNDLRDYVSEAWDDVPKSTVCIDVEAQEVLDLLQSTIINFHLNNKDHE